MRLMRGSSRRLMGLVLAVGTLLAAIVAVSTLSQGRFGMHAGARSTPIDSATRQEVSRHALRWTTVEYEVLSGVARIALARDLTLDDLLSLGTCPRPDADPADPRYVLVVVSGDLDLSNWPGVGRHPDPNDRRYRYIAYIVDTEENTPRLKQQLASRNGWGFHEILDDPSLPDDVAAGSPPGSRQVDTTMTLESCPAFSEYGVPKANPGQVEPTVAPPTQR